MRMARLIVFGFLVASCVAAVAMAVDNQGGAQQATKDDAPEAAATVTGVLRTTADGYAVGSRPVSFGPPWYAASSALIKERLGKSVSVTGREDDDGELSVRTIDGVTYRSKGRPPWAGGPKHHGASASACKAKAAKAKAVDKEKANDKTAKAGEDKGGPPPWAKAYGRRCTA